MSVFKQYKRKAIAELRAVTDNEIMSRQLDSKISVSMEDKENGSPLAGDMVARNPKNHDDQWLVARKYFEDNFEPAEVNSDPVHIIAVLDASGSMNSSAEDVIGSYNTFIKEQKEVGDNAIVTLIIFASGVTYTYKEVPINQVEDLTSATYKIGGLTALNDAVGEALSFKDKKAMVMIQTDGIENSSSRFTLDTIKKLVVEKEKLGWDINFIGCDIDAVASATSLGISAGKAYSMPKSARGFDQTFKSMSVTATNYRN